MEFAARWATEKNEALRQRYGIGFEEVLVAVAEGRVLAEAPHPNPERYPSQRVLVVEIGGYAWVAPYVPDASGPVLKTIYPSRKHQRLVRAGDADD